MKGGEREREKERGKRGVGKGGGDPAGCYGKFAALTVSESPALSRDYKMILYPDFMTVK